MSKCREIDLGEGRRLQVLEGDSFVDPANGKSLTGAWVWDASIVLAMWFTTPTWPPGCFKNKRVVELGSGTSVPGMALATLGAHVVLTDRKPLMAGMEANIDANGLRHNARAAELQWGADRSQLDGIMQCFRQLEAEAEIVEGVGRLEGGGGGGGEGKAEGERGAGTGRGSGAGARGGAQETERGDVSGAGSDGTEGGTATEGASVKDGATLTEGGTPTEGGTATAGPSGPASVPPSRGGEGEEQADAQGQEQQQGQEQEQRQDQGQAQGQDQGKDKGKEQGQGQRQEDKQGQGQEPGQGQGQEQAEGEEDNPYAVDFVVGSDIMFDPESETMVNLSTAIKWLSGKRTRIFMCCELRPPLPECFRHMHDSGLRWKAVPQDQLHPDWSSEDIKIFEFFVGGDDIDEA